MCLAMRMTIMMHSLRKASEIESRDRWGKKVALVVKSHLSSAKLLNRTNREAMSCLNHQTRMKRNRSLLMRDQKVSPKNKRKRANKKRQRKWRQTRKEDRIKITKVGQKVTIKLNIYHWSRIKGRKLLVTMSKVAVVAVTLKQNTEKKENQAKMKLGERIKAKREKRNTKTYRKKR